MNSSAFKANVHLNIVSSSSVFLKKKKENPCIFVRSEGKPSLTTHPRRSRGSAFLKDADFSATTKQQEVLFIYVCLLFFLLRLLLSLFLL